MKIFGKKKKEAKRKDPKHIRLMRLGLWKLAKRFRLRERIGKANQWCEQHKGRTASFINNFRHTDDTTLIAESEEELKSPLIKVKGK